MLNGVFCWVGDSAEVEVMEVRLPPKTSIVTSKENISFFNIVATIMAHKTQLTIWISVF